VGLRTVVTRQGHEGPVRRRWDELRVGGHLRRMRSASEHPAGRLRQKVPRPAAAGRMDPCPSGWSSGDGDSRDRDCLFARVPLEGASDPPRTPPWQARGTKSRGISQKELDARARTPRFLDGGRAVRLPTDPLERGRGPAFGAARGDPWTTGPGSHSSQDCQASTFGSVKPVCNGHCVFGVARRSSRGAGLRAGLPAGHRNPPLEAATGGVHGGVRSACFTELRLDQATQPQPGGVCRSGTPSSGW
jgi:hypothetical protein